MYVSWSFLVVQWLGLHTSIAGGTSLIPGQETKTPHVVQHSHKKKCVVSLSFVPNYYLTPSHPKQL